MKAILFANTDWYLFNFRLSLARALRDEGYEVLLLSPDGDYGPKFAAEGFRWEAFPFSRKGMNPLQELETVLRLRSLYRAERPDVVHHFTVKCVMNGSLAAHMTGVPKIINGITGLGFLWEKGVGEFVEAARILNSSSRTLSLSKGSADNEMALRTPREQVQAQATKAIARFVLVGDTYPDNPGAVSPEKLQQWVDEGLVEWWGWHDDMSDVFPKAHIVCLPSYREGMPLSLAEAGACARPLVTTDVPGCREIVQDGVNGFLVPVRDAGSLAEALRKLIDDPALRAEMGRRGRALVEAEFSVGRIVSETLQVYNQE